MVCAAGVAVRRRRSTLLIDNRNDKREPRAKEILILTRLLRSAGMVALVAATSVFVAPNAYAQADPQAHIAASQVTLSNFLRDPDMDWLQRNFYRAKAVIITPEVVKAGFIFGGSGGRALVVARDPTTGGWVGPAFYAMATASVGFQAGISVAEGVTLVMTEKGFNSLLATSFKIGGDASVAAGPVGAGARSDIVADLITFNRAKGVYGGLNLDGTVVTPSDDWNASFYGKRVLPPDILVRDIGPQPSGRQAARAGQRRCQQEVESGQPSIADHKSVRGPTRPLSGSASIAVRVRRARPSRYSHRRRSIQAIQGHWV